MEEATMEELYAIRTIPGKGNGLIATKPIRQGTLILSESPLLSVDKNLTYEQGKAALAIPVAALTQTQRNAFLSLFNNHRYNDTGSQYTGIYLSNCLEMNKKSGVFLNASRINHACDNNAHPNWNASIGRNTIHALRDIMEGEEITISYMPVFYSKAYRRAVCQSTGGGGFTCTCQRCSLSPEESRQSDARLNEMRRLESAIVETFAGMASETVKSSPRRAFRMLAQILHLYSIEAPHDARVAIHLFEASAVARALHDLARAHVLHQRAMDRLKISSGEQYASTFEHDDPMLNDLIVRHWAHDERWRTSFEDIPPDLGEEDFEDWLWRRESPSLGERGA